MLKLPFYPNHDYGCPHVKSCPHLGGASLGSLVMSAGDHSEEFQRLQKQLDAQRERNDKLFAENEKLEQKVEQLQLELRLERQAKFATNKQNDEATTDDAPDESAPKKKQKKPGAPVGHPGWYRPMPLKYDILVEVPAPKKCPHCDSGKISIYNSQPISEHLQEDVVDGRDHVTLFTHPCARCLDCRRFVQQAGEGEILGSRVGPEIRSKAIYLHFDIGISYRKVSRAIKDLLGFTFSPAALLGFEEKAASRAKPIVKDIEKKIASTEGPVHADETYWTLDGERAYYWVHATEDLIHFIFETTRSGQVSRNVLGEDFAGTLVTDCYSGYHAQNAAAKQKCLVHLSRRAKDWRRLTEEDTDDFEFFSRVINWVTLGCKYDKKKTVWSERTLKKKRQWLTQELSELMNLTLKHEKALTLQARITRHVDEWLVFTKDDRVPATNNFAERCLRPLVIMRKISFGNRSRQGGERMASIMTLNATARLRGHNPLEILYSLLTKPPDKVMEQMYAKTSAN